MLLPYESEQHYDQCKQRKAFSPLLSHPIYWQLLFFSINVHVLFSTVHCALFFFAISCSQLSSLHSISKT